MLVNGVQYTYAVSAQNVAGIGAQSSSVQATPRTVPSAPSGLLAVPDDARVDLSWNAPDDDGGSAITYYIVYRDDLDIGHPTVTTLSDVGLENGRAYSYKVLAHNAAGNGPLSSSVQATPFTVPGAPEDLQATPGDGFINLTWSDPAFDGGSPITGYQIWRGEASGSEISWTTVTGHWYNDTGLVNGQDYYYLVKAVNAAGAGEGSNEVTAEPSPDLVAPSEPLDLRISAGNEHLTLTWDPPGNNGGSPVTGYKVYRGAVSGGETYLLTLGVQLSYVNTGLENGLTYYYRISALNVIGEGPLSDEASATPVSVPGAPAGLTASPGNGQVYLEWSAPDDNGAAIIHYIVYRNGEDVGHAASVHFTDLGLTNGATYEYRIAAVNDVGSGPLSSAVQAVPFTIPDAPTGLTATVGNAQVTLTWIAPAFDGGSEIDYYIVFRNGEDHAHVLTTNHIDTGLSNGLTYYYIVAAHNAAGNGYGSAEVQAVPFTLPGAPTDLHITVNGTLLSLAWNAPDDDGGAVIDHYIVYRDGEDFMHTSATVYGYIDTDLGAHVFAVAAHNAAGTGEMSEPVEVIISMVPSAPVSLQATPGDGEVLLTWSVPASPGPDAITYHLFRDGVEIWSGAETNRWDVGLVKGIAHDYMVAASNAYGWGANSTAVQAAALGVPDAPNDLQAEGLIGGVHLSWAAPDYAGPGILTYHVFRDGEEVWSGTATSCTDTGTLMNGEMYSYTVSASNSIGWGENSTAATAVPLAPYENGWDMPIMLIAIVIIIAGVAVAVAILLMRRK
jgi:titin